MLGLDALPLEDELLLDDELDELELLELELELLEDELLELELLLEEELLDELELLLELEPVPPFNCSCEQPLASTEAAGALPSH